MKVSLTAAQYAELEVLVLAMQNPKSQANTTTMELQVNSTKVEYVANAVEFTLTD